MSENDKKEIEYPTVPPYDQDVQFDTIQEAIDVFVATRDDLTEHRRAFENYERQAKAYMSRIQMVLKDKADALGVDSFKTEAGTAYRTVKTSYRVGNWDEYWAWLKENDFSQCVEKRAAKLAVAEIHNETGELPPGLTYEQEIVFDVRRPTKKRK